MNNRQRNNNDDRYARMDSFSIRGCIQTMLNERSEKASIIFNAANDLNIKIAEGLQKILGTDPERVLRNLPDFTARSRYCSPRHLSDNDKIEILTRAIIRDFKIVKCSRISEMIHNHSGKDISCTDLRRIPNSVLDVLENALRR
ncbi:MAG TPA: hypothetical protein VIS27_07065 [Yeosuana sp.]